MIPSARRLRLALGSLGAILAVSICSISTEATAGPSIRSLEHLLLRQGVGVAFDRGDSFTDLGRAPRGHAICMVYHVVHIDVKSPHDESQAILLITYRGRYVGRYDVETDASPSKITSDHDVIYKLPESDGNRIHFEQGGPPKSVKIDGQTYRFWPVSDERCLINPSCPRYATLRHHDPE